MTNDDAMHSSSDAGLEQFSGDLSTKEGVENFVNYLYSGAKWLLSTLGSIPPTIFLFTNYPIGGQVRAQEVALAMLGTADTKKITEAMKSLITNTHSVGIAMVGTIEEKSKQKFTISIEHRKLGRGPISYSAAIVSENGKKTLAPLEKVCENQPEYSLMPILN